MPAGSKFWLVQISLYRVNCPNCFATFTNPVSAKVPASAIEIGQHIELRSQRDGPAARHTEVDRDGNAAFNLAVADAGAGGGQLHERQDGKLEVALEGGKPLLEANGRVAHTRDGGDIADSITPPHPGEGYPVQLDVTTVGQAVFNVGLVNSSWSVRTPAAVLFSQLKVSASICTIPFGTVQAKLDLVGRSVQIGASAVDAGGYNILCQGRTCKQCGKQDRATNHSSIPFRAIRS